MPVERYFYQDLLKVGNEIFLEDDEHHHLARVTRGRAGENVEIINGKGQIGTAVINSIDKRKTTLSIASVFTEPFPSYSLLLYQGIPRLNRLETVMEKATELGVTEILLFPSERSEKKQISDHQLDRLNAITIAAVKQSGRLFLPKITLLEPIKKWEPLQDMDGYYGDVRQEALWLVDVLEKKKDNAKRFAFCIGPESGLSLEETNLLEQKGFSGIKLHQNILRTDTAAIAAITIASYYTQR